MPHQTRTASKSRSHSFLVTRGQHTSELAEDYTELIADLVREQGEARITDIARALGVSHVTALRTVARLQDMGLVNTAPRKPVVLTKRGEALALKSRERHQTLVDFLVFIGVPIEVARVDAEGAEHHMSDATLKVMREFMKK